MRMPRAHGGDDEVDAAKEEGHELKGHSNEPQRRAGGCHVVVGVGRERWVGGPRTVEAAALHEERRYEDDRRNEEHLVAEPVDAGKHHVIAADHQRDEQVAKRGDEHRHGEPENHDGAVVCDRGIVFQRRHVAEAGDELAGEGKLHAKRIGEKPADERHEDARPHVLLSDDLVIRRPEVLQEEVLLFVVAMIVVGVVGSGHVVLSSFDSSKEVLVLPQQVLGNSVRFLMARWPSSRSRRIRGYRPRSGQP